MPSRPEDSLQLDELWSFVWCRKNWVWIWLVMCKRTRQIVAYFTGDRSIKSAFELKKRIPAAYQHCVSVSDYWEAYQVFDPDRHLQVSKSTGLTNHIERDNGIMRQRIVRLARDTLRYSRCAEMHDAVIKLWILAHNQRCSENIFI